MMRDIPKVVNVTYSEYADDITIYCVSTAIVTATTNIQLAIDWIFSVDKGVRTFPEWNLNKRHDVHKKMNNPNFPNV